MKRDVALQELIRFTHKLWGAGIPCRVTGGLRLRYYNVRFAHALTTGDRDYIEDILREDGAFQYHTPRNRCVLVNGIVPVLIHSAMPEWYGSASIFLTGPKFFTKGLVNIAKSQGYKLNMRGLWLRDERIAGVSEHQVFRMLGENYVTPERRREIGKTIRDRRRKAFGPRSYKPGNE